MVNAKELSYMISCLACLFFDYAIYEVSANTRENSLSSSSNLFLLVGSFMERYFVFLVVHDEVSKQEGKGNIKQLFYMHFCVYLNQCRNIAEGYTF